MAKIWFVTGSTRGLGRALVKAILASGDNVVATARNANALADFVEKYGSDRVLALSLDITNNDAVISAVNKAVQTFGRLDVVVNNAGYADTAPVETMTIEAFCAQIETNFFGVVNVSKAVLPTLRQQGAGHIIQVSSLGGRMGMPGLSAYQSAKWAVGGFSGVLSRELSPLGIKVIVLEPGGIKTDWAGVSMGVGEISEPYQQTVGAFLEFRIRPEVTEGWADPAHVADVILRVSQLEDPPLRLLAGCDTVEYAKQAADALRASDEKWRELTISAT